VIFPWVFCLMELRVELRGLEPLTPCLQIGLSTCGQDADLASEVPASIRDVPLATGVNGTLMAQRSWL